MIYFNNQLMPDDTSAKLFLVTNTKPFERYEDHEAALYIKLHELVEQDVSFPYCEVVEISVEVPPN